MMSVSFTTPGSAEKRARPVAMAEDDDGGSPGARSSLTVSSRPAAGFRPRTGK